MVHTKRNEIHATAGLALGATGAFLGWTEAGMQAAAIGAILGAAAGLFAGELAVKQLQH